MKNHRRFCIFMVFAIVVCMLTMDGCKTSPPSAPVDTAPTATITSHSNGDIIYAIDTIVVAATDDRKVTIVEMYVNGQLAATDSAAPWNFRWVTEQWNDGSYNLQAKAYDEPGHVGASPVVNVTVRNAAPTSSITSPVTNEVCSGIDTVFVSAYGANTLTKVELYVNGSLWGTDYASPWRFIWDTRQSSDGAYTLQAKAHDVAGHVGTSASVNVTVRNTAGFAAKFINTVYTPMSITVQGVTRTVQPDDSTTFSFTSNPQSLVYDASTSGKTSGGTQIGLMLSWGGTGNPINVSSYSSVRLSLQASSTYFFMYMSNTGATLSPVYVNYGLSDQTVDYISIPGDGVKYSIGYYNAHSGATVRAYKYPSTTSYVYWTLSFTSAVNQSLWFTNSLLKIAAGAAELQIQAGGIIQSSLIASDQKSNRTLGPNTIVVFPNEK